MQRFVTYMFLVRMVLIAGFILSGFMTDARAGSWTGGGPRVVVTIAPVGGLVARVMAGIGQPELLIAGTVSPHAYNLKPSDAKLLEDAEVVFWIGPELETALRKPIEVLSGGARVVSFMAISELELLTRRKAGIISPDNSPAISPANDHDQRSGSLDPHIWLDPRNAAMMLMTVARTLADLDPDNGVQYTENALAGVREIEHLDAVLATRLEKLKMARQGFIFFHDAYQYFEHRYSLKPAAIIQIDPDHAPGARRLSQVRSVIESFSAVCVFSEPQYKPRLIETLTENTTARHATLDPVGSTIKADDRFYGKLMRSFVDDFVACLSGE